MLSDRHEFAYPQLISTRLVLWLRRGASSVECPGSGHELRHPRGLPSLAQTQVVMVASKRMAEGSGTAFGSSKPVTKPKSLRVLLPFASLTENPRPASASFTSKKISPPGSVTPDQPTVIRRFPCGGS